MTKSIDAPHIARAKRVAKKLQRTLREIEEQPSLSHCQEAAACILGFSDWHDLSKAHGFILTPPDEDMKPDDLARRRERQCAVLTESLPILQSLGDDAVLAIVQALRPSAFAPPRSLLEAAAQHDLADDAIIEGFESLGPQGPACDVACSAHDVLSRDHAEAIRLARAALVIDPECIDAHELLGIVADDPVEAIASHRRSSGRAQTLYAEAQRTWCARNPSDDPKLFWEFIGARPFIRAHMNLGNALVRAAEWGMLDRDVALNEAVSVFGYLLKVLPRSRAHAALERRMMARMLLGDAQGAARDAAMKKRQERNAPLDCWTAWTLAWADLAQHGLGTVFIAEAIEACPFALPLLLDGGGELDWRGHDRTGPRAAEFYVAEARHIWLRTPGALAALESFRPVAMRMIAEAKRQFAAKWGSALPPDLRKPLPPEWRA